MPTWRGSPRPYPLAYEPWPRPSVTSSHGAIWLRPRYVTAPTCPGSAPLAGPGFRGTMAGSRCRAAPPAHPEPPAQEGERRPSWRMHGCFYRMFVPGPLRRPSRPTSARARRGFGARASQGAGGAAPGAARTLGTAPGTAPGTGARRDRGTRPGHKGTRPGQPRPCPSGSLCTLSPCSQEAARS